MLSFAGFCTLFELHAGRRIWAIRYGVNEGSLILAREKNNEVSGPVVPDYATRGDGIYMPEPAMGGVLGDGPPSYRFT